MNIKNLLREELLLNDSIKSLNSESMIMINNVDYLKYVLGIEIPINENYSLGLRKQIIEEQLLLQTMLNSINKFIGSSLEKGKEKTIEVVNSISNVKDIAILMKDLILVPELMNSAVKSISRVANNLKQELEDIVAKINKNVKLGNISEKFNNLINKVISTLTNLTNGNGWKGFLSMVGFCGLIKFLLKGILYKIIKGVVEFVNSNTNIMEGLVSMFNSFGDFVADINGTSIQPILSWLGEIGSNVSISGLLVGINILAVLAEILAPVIKEIHWAKKSFK